MHRQMSGLAGRPGPKSSGQGGSKASAVCDQRKLYAIKKIRSSDLWVSHSRVAVRQRSEEQSKYEIRR